MLAGTASVITAATGCAASTSATASRSLYGSTIVCAVWPGVTPALSGNPRVAIPLPAWASNASEWPW